ncbi:hypothetical protein GGS21DRAFT_495134 [Xylaria nigripes]|nr:hypothetical protein GGS21DRAFT_495134 [Xylaria nigripes]
MGAGLDELIESLLTEIALSGVRGCSVSNLLIAIDSFYKSSDKSDGYEDANIAQTAIADGNYANLQQDSSSRHDLAVASKVWKWLAARPDVYIGANKEFNHLSLQEVLALPEEVEPPPSVANVESSTNKSPSVKTKSPSHPRSTLPLSSNENPTVRPRIHVSEERQWRTITGHGPDLKRVPLFEWRALVDIASVKKKGILQGDLVRLTGQDKRSLPTRTDALARKGYVIKQPVVLRGGKSSKLWLAQFWEDAKGEQEREGLDYETLDLSKSALTSDLYPVPFADKWNGETIDYLALAQGFVAIVKAWELIRYCDARAKLGVGERVRQMRALAKTCRWLTNMGALSFVGAKFAGSNRLFKDCVKYIRDPSPAEWSHFRATPKTRMVMPSGRIGKRGEASRAVHASQAGGPGGKATVKKTQSTKGRNNPTPHISMIPSPWKPQKPLPNTAFEIIKTAGSTGTSNAAIYRQTLGYNFRRLISAMTGSISMPTNSQPSHLKHLSSTSRLSRIGKTMTYTFYANSEIPELESGEQQQNASCANAETTTSKNVAGDATTCLNRSMFSQPDLSRFSSSTASSLTEITQTQQLNRVFSRKPKRRRPHEDEDDQPPAKAPRRPGRPRRHPTVKQPQPEAAEEQTSPGGDNAAPGPEEQSDKDERPEPKTSEPSSRAPGVYRGLPNSLDPIKRRKGRRPKSLVLIFRSDKLKDPSFLGKAPASSAPPDENSSSHPDDAQGAPTEPPSPIKDTPTGASCSAVTPLESVSENLSIQSRPTRSKKNGLFWCEKCGNNWKNSNGLEYHLTKSRTVCNPEYIPESSELINHRRHKRQVVNRSLEPRSVTEDHGQYRQTLTPKEQVESRFDAKKHISSSRSKKPPPSVSSSPDEGIASTSHTGASIVLKELEVYDAAEHQRTLRQQSIGTNKETPAGNESATIEDAHASSIHGQPQSPAIVPTGSKRRRSKANKHGVRGSPSSHASGKTTERAGSLIDGLPETINSPRESFTVPPTEGYSVRKPLPNVSTIRRVNSDTLPPKATTQSSGPDADETGDRNLGVSTIQPEPFVGNTTSRLSSNKPLASFARISRPNASFGARRRDRTIQIIEYLLEQNVGVFPGLRSLFMAVISVWAKEFGDLAPPDRRVCQNTVNQLERDGKLRQMHFFFFDDQAKMQECVVLAKTGSGRDIDVDSSDDPRVIAVKEKMREMFPVAYVPDAFSLSPDEAKLFDELASQGKEHNQARKPRVPRALKKVQDIETLRYDDSVMGEIPIHRSYNKRQADDVQVEVQPTSKRLRFDLEQPDTLERSRKPRRRPGKHELWDSGRLAVYIWSQRQKPGAMWDQPRSCFQDPTTGAWSWMPDADSSKIGSISSILSSVKSAKDIDAALKRQGRRAWPDYDSVAGQTYDQYGDQSGREASVINGDVLLAERDKYGRSDIPYLGAPASVFEANSSASDEYAEDIYEESSELSGNESTDSETFRIKSTEARSNRKMGVWPYSRGSIASTRDAASVAAATPVANTRQQLKENLPRDVQDILKTARHRSSVKKWVDPVYGEFLRDLKTIRRWEQSAERFHLLTHGAIISDYVFISLTIPASKANMEPTNLEWLSGNQLTADNVPDEVKNASPEDDNFGLSYLVDESKKTTDKKKKKREYKRRKLRATADGSGISQSIPSHTQSSFSHTSESPMQHEGFIEYKTRDLTVIPRQPRGRFNKPAAHDEKLGAKREDELLAACVVFRTLLGGLDRNLDIGLLLKHFPGMSLSAIKKFWPRISRERKSYVQALTAKFQAAFLEAYENGDLPPLDYDDIENYDWPGLISWTTQLETHEDVDLPGSRNTLHEKHHIEDVNNEATDWRETWFATTSIYNRIEAVASETMSIPLPPKSRPDRAILERARTWVRSICCTSLRGVNVGDKLVPKLLELGDGDVAKTNQILQKTVSELNREKVITRTKGKDIGGNFRIHGMFSKQLEKMASTPKFRQAMVFKIQLDEVFLRGEDFIMPYASDDGSIMAALNLQSHGRIRIETVDMPNIPFGFEPGNYEGRTFPKSYYHFKVRIVPTETYLFNEDMALLKQAHSIGLPAEGPEEKIPIWVDFFGKVNTARWADYVSMVAFTLAIKGPMSPAMCVTLLKPMIEEFEVRLIVDWLDKLGLVQQVVTGCGVTVAEWWWLLVGHLVQTSDKERGETQRHKLAADEV